MNNPFHEIRTILTGDFPETLQNIPNPPEFLYIRGALPPPHYKFLCVIGSRKYSSYGQEVCANLIQGLKGYPISIVSGLAIGIDSLAHEAALDAKLHTIAFPGSGLNWDVLYPAAHRPLAKRILESGGALLSEYEAGYLPEKWTFVERNILMAGISHATLIIEGRKKSGTLSTADAALKFNRDVLVVPGSIFSDLSVTPLKLMSDGAHPVTSSEDILRILGLLPPEIIEPNDPRSNSQASKSDASKSPQKSVDSISNAMNPTLFDTLSPEEQKIIERVRAPVSRDELIRELDLPAGYVNSLLVNLELRGLVVERGGYLTVK